MTADNKTILVCNCEQTMEIDGQALACAIGRDDALPVHSHLCRAGVQGFSRALEDSKNVLVCCTQEAPLFRELAGEMDWAGDLSFTNIRERAGWSGDTTAKTAKMAALIAEARLDDAPARTTTLTSDGTCLVYGAGDSAFAVAEKLSGRLNVTLVLTDAGEVLPPSIVDVPVYSGTIARAGGHFGAFDITVDGYAPVIPSSRQRLDFALARDGARSTCDIIVDVSGGEPLFANHKRLDGYFHVKPTDRLGMAEAVFAACDLVGEFEKPIYIDYDASLCAHGRSSKTGCTRCLDVCPVSAIAPDGDHVAFDAALCGGCGGCASVCPSGAAGYDMPTRFTLLERARTLLDVYRGAGGHNARLLVHDEHHGAQMIAILARLANGLPANVIPFAVNEVTQIGHEFLLFALAGGAQGVDLLINPAKRDEISGLENQVSLARQLITKLGYGSGEQRISMIDELDPDSVGQALYRTFDLQPARLETPAPLAGKREAARAALHALHQGAPNPQQVIALDGDSPYGRIRIDTDGCTLCLSCVSACPLDAIRDNPDRPEVRFIENNCVQCGLCASTCPEHVITLEARYTFTSDVMTPQILHTEEPATCIRCGNPFGVKSSIDRVAAALAGKHSMFRTEEAQTLLRMCDNCRIEHQALSANDPFAAGPRPAVRTAEDYLIDDDTH